MMSISLKLLLNNDYLNRNELKIGGVPLPKRLKFVEAS